MTYNPINTFSLPSLYISLHLNTLSSCAFFDGVVIGAEGGGRGGGGGATGVFFGINAIGL